AVETDTFRSNRITLGEYGLGDRVREINIAAAQVARRAADRFSTPEHPRFVAGSIGPSGFLPSASDPTLGNITFDQLVPVFAEQARAPVEGGVDLLLIETSQDILETKAAIFGCRQAIAEADRPVALQVQVTLDTSGRMLLGTDNGAALVTLEAPRGDDIGQNCSTGPEHMRQAVRYLSENCTVPISIIPNAGIPHNEGGCAVYPLKPEPFAEQMAEFVTEFGVGAVGGCCGTTPEHLRLLIERLGDHSPKPREVVRVPRVSSGIRAFDLVQTPAPTMIGERVNAQGSRKVKRHLLADEYDGVLDVAREQVEGGAHLLDVCVALTERQDEADQMRSVVKLLSQGVEAPLSIDSTEANVIEAALKQSPGRAVVNSINLENGRERIDSVLPLVAEHGAAVVALTIDEEGMAKTAERKLAVARRIVDIVTKDYGIEPESIIFDDLTFTLATGDPEFRRSAIETIEGIRLIKRELPGVLTSLGVSNVSFGLSKPARAVLNSVFLHLFVEAGLDMAIVNPAHITPYDEIDDEQRRLADDLIYDRSEDALARFIAYFETRGVETEEAADPTADMEPEEALHWKILHRKKDGIEGWVDRAIEKQMRAVRAGRAVGAVGAGAPAPAAESGLEAAADSAIVDEHATSVRPDDPDGPKSVRHEAAVTVLSQVLLPAMKEVGDKFGAGELILPFVLQSA